LRNKGANDKDAPDPTTISSIPVISLLFGSKVIDALPTVRIPVILASPSTKSAVDPTPT